MQVTARLAAIERRGAAKRTAVESAGVDAEVAEQSGQAIHGWLPRAVLDDGSHIVDDLHPIDQRESLA
jgi:hypothetical protein